jgi:hypothetical protein
MNTLDLIQTICAVLGLVISLYAVSEVVKIKKKINIDTSIKDVKQTIKGDNNKQSNGNRINTHS